MGFGGKTINDRFFFAKKIAVIEIPVLSGNLNKPPRESVIQK